MNDQFSPHFWQLIVECIQHKSHNWKYAFISKGGRHTLIQATLSNIPIYYLSLFVLLLMLLKAWINWLEISFGKVHVARVGCIMLIGRLFNDRN